MKTAAEIKFDQMVKEVYHQTLKPLGYKKKGNNFYLPGTDIGKIINLQKSTFHSKDHIRFTINASIFSPHYFDAYFNYFGKQMPEYPNETECVIRNRIGRLLKQEDTWYDISSETNLLVLKANQQHNLDKVILPYFSAVNTIDDLLNEIDKTQANDKHFKLYMLAAVGRVLEARDMFSKMINDPSLTVLQRNRTKDIGDQFALS